MAHGDDLAPNVERSAWSLYRLCPMSSSKRDIDTALAYIHRAVDEHPANGIATRGYATSYLPAINLVFKKGSQAGVDIGEKDLKQFGALKAADCTVVHANQFINNAKTGEGENPRRRYCAGVGLVPTPLTEVSC